MPSCFGDNDDQMCLHNSLFSCLMYVNSSYIILMYADDMVLLSISASGLQNRLNKIKVFCENNEINLI